MTTNHRGSEGKRDRATADLLQWHFAGMVLVSVSFRTQPHKRPEVLSAVDEILERMRNTPACGRCRLLVDSDDSNAFIIASEWTSRLDADAFFSSRDFHLFRGMRILLRGEPLIVLDQVNDRETRTVH